MQDNRDVTILFNEKTTSPSQRLDVLKRLEEALRLRVTYNIGLMDRSGGNAVSHLNAQRNLSAAAIVGGVRWAASAVDKDLKVQQGEPDADSAPALSPPYEPAQRDIAVRVASNSLVLYVS